MYKGHTLKSLALFLIYLLPNQLLAHGGVFVEDDLCVIQIGFFKAHFTIYQPEIAGNKEYCEDIPNTGTSLFILDYLHESLNTLPVDFRIIKNVTDHGRATTWQHLSAMNDLEQHTVYYQPDMVVLNGTLEAEYNFTETGHYVGIVTTRQPGNQKIYTEDLFNEASLKRLCAFAGADHRPPESRKAVNETFLKLDLPDEVRGELQAVLQPQYEFCRQRFGNAVPASWLQP